MLEQLPLPLLLQLIEYHTSFRDQAQCVIQRSDMRFAGLINRLQGFLNSITLVLPTFP